MYDNHSFDHSSIFNKLQEESSRKGYTMNRGVVTNNDYTKNSVMEPKHDENRTVGNPLHISPGKVAGGIAIAVGAGYLLNKFVIQPIREYFEDLEDEIVVKPATDAPIMDGNIRPLTRREARELARDPKTVMLTPSDYVVRDAE